MLIGRDGPVPIHRFRDGRVLRQHNRGESSTRSLGPGDQGRRRPTIRRKDKSLRQGRQDGYSASQLRKGVCDSRPENSGSGQESLECTLGSRSRRLATIHGSPQRFHDPCFYFIYPFLGRGVFGCQVAPPRTRHTTLGSLTLGTDGSRTPTPYCPPVIDLLFHPLPFRPSLGSCPKCPQTSGSLFGGGKVSNSHKVRK